MANINYAIGTHGIMSNTGPVSRYSTRTECSMYVVTYNVVPLEVGERGPAKLRLDIYFEILSQNRYFEIPKSCSMCSLYPIEKKTIYSVTIPYSADEMNKLIREAKINGLKLTDIVNKKRLLTYTYQLGYGKKTPTSNNETLNKIEYVAHSC